jgi:hypothetical protein
MSKTFPKKIDKISMSVFPRLFLFYRVFGCFSAMGVQNHCKKRFTKKIVRKVLQKIRQKNQNRFFLDFCLSRFWAFLGEGSSKKSDPIPFLCSSEPGLTHPQRGSPICFLPAPCCQSVCQLSEKLTVYSDSRARERVYRYCERWLWLREQRQAYKIQAAAAEHS